MTSKSVMRRVTATRSPGVLYDDLVAMLRRLEWSRDSGGCPECDGYQPGFNQGISPALEGHSPNCDLATLLRDLP